MTLDQRLVGPNHHEEAIVDVGFIIIVVVVIDGYDVKQMLALAATREGFVVVEVELGMSLFRHLLDGEALEQAWGSWW